MGWGNQGTNSSSRAGELPMHVAEQKLHHSDLGQGGWTGTGLLPIPLAALATVLGQGSGAQGPFLMALPP